MVTNLNKMFLVFYLYYANFKELGDFLSFILIKMIRINYYKQYKILEDIRIYLIFIIIKERLFILV
ncbi:hypothetical protein Calag_1513 [Caldisphaera lagunensis DSM 15908]|uniref:Uncharacterized protein n=1 Tax=Caldisphaera lagunensis (strain DSM 15908 / JCM 11604 / ANMR 0165 / IC-154) TaxID=1056495 RepID=L0ABE0_CALLD|nr:hypothetical protein Calag_1513 [Caldisphaera lagunensis DSM 15908]